MSTSHRGIRRRAPFSASLALLGLCGGLMSTAAHADTDTNASCRQETKRVAVWPKAPKAPRQARWEEREVTVCDDGAAVSKRSKDGERSSKSGD